jgi:choline dehydrogenase
VIDDLRTADYVVVGGGLAGCVVPARLSEHPGIRVVLIEAGGENLLESSYYATGVHGRWKTEANWGFSTVPQAELHGQRVDQPRGKVLGGSAAINIGSWSRGTAADYDAWEAAGAIGWNWQDALRTFRAIETSQRPDDAVRGRHGPLILEDTPAVSGMTALLRQACIEAGFGATVDHNGERLDGFDIWETIFFRGRRQNTAAAYLDPARPRGNLKILTGALALKVIVRDGTATGVVVEVDGAVTTIGASREVVLCAGAFGTPHLLMLSGIGPAQHLRAHGVEMVLDAPGVGTRRTTTAT